MSLTLHDLINLLQGGVLDGHALSLQLSHSRKETKSTHEKKHDKSKSSTKIIVRNVAFEATKKDLQQLFSPFGQVLYSYFVLLKKVQTKYCGNDQKIIKLRWL